jgi:hypothetical protein
MSLAIIGAGVAVVATVVGLIVQVLTAGIYIGKLEGFQKFVNYRFDEQDKRLDAHNNFITRIYDLESKDRVKEEQIRVANHRIDDLEEMMK